MESLIIPLIEQVLIYKTLFSHLVTTIGYAFLPAINKSIHAELKSEHVCGVMVKVMDSGIVVSELKLQSCYYIHFQTNTLGKGMNPFILPAMG